MREVREGAVTPSHSSSITRGPNLRMMATTSSHYSLPRSLCLEQHSWEETNIGLPSAFSLPALYNNLV